MLLKVLVETAQVDDVIYTVFSMHGNDFLTATDKCQATRLIKIGAGDMQIPVALRLDALKQVIGEVVAGNSEDYLRDSRFNSSGMRAQQQG